MEFVHYVEKVSGVDIYGIASFLIFFIFFIVIGVWAFKADRKVINYMSNLPLNTDSENL